MAWPPDPIAADKANATDKVDDHAPHHNALADAINDLVAFGPAPASSTPVVANGGVAITDANFARPTAPLVIWPMADGVVPVNAVFPDIIHTAVPVVIDTAVPADALHAHTATEPTIGPAAASAPLFSDDFNRATLGADWTLGTINTNQWESGVTGPRRGLYTPSIGELPVDHYSQALVTNTAGQRAGVVVNATDDANAYFCHVRHDTGTYFIIKIVSGSASGVASVTPGTMPTAPYTVRLEATRASTTWTLRMLVNGTEVLTGTDTALGTGGGAGVCAEGASTVRLDDWEASGL